MIFPFSMYTWSCGFVNAAWCQAAGWLNESMVMVQTSERYTPAHALGNREFQGWLGVCDPFDSEMAQKENIRQRSVVNIEVAARLVLSG